MATSRYGVSSQGSKRGRRKDKKRKVESRDQRIRILIVCEGACTEPQYFEALVRHYDLNKRFHIDTKGEGANTESLVKRAVDISKRAQIPYDEIWVVFDKDSFADSLCQRAFELAQQEGIQVAFSHEAFELWYLLHFDHLTAQLSRDQYITKLKDKARLGQYEKSDPFIFEQLITKGDLQSAIKRAEKLIEDYERADGHFDPLKHHPSTTVHKLVKRLLSEH